MPRVSAKLAKATVKAPNALLVTVPYLKVVEPDLVPRRGEPYSNSSLIVVDCRTNPLEIFGPS